MPVKILLADKSITIQKVVEMLFSGRDYEIVCVSDGDSALNEAARVVPDVVLADLDLPRIDGYTLATRLKQTPQLARIPVILMMSRDDVFDGPRAAQAGILDHIAKPFESQDLIGKVKKALAAAPPRIAEPASPAKSGAMPASAPAPSKPKPSAPADIFDIISEAPTQLELARATAPVEEESVYEVEPVVEEVEGPLSGEVAKPLPVVGAQAREESGPKQASPSPAAMRPEPPAVSEDALRGMVEEMVAKLAKEALGKAIPAPLPREELRRMAEETVSRMAQDVFKNMAPPVPKISPETVRRGIEDAVMKIAREIAREVIEKVAWEVIPQLAEVMIKEEIERLKAAP